jgi:hypothetical protein
MGKIHVDATPVEVGDQHFTQFQRSGVLFFRGIFHPGRKARILPGFCDRKNYLLRHCWHTHHGRCQGERQYYQKLFQGTPPALWAKNLLDKSIAHWT